jgi:hypothetical protein
MTLLGLEQLIPQILLASLFSIIFIYSFDPRRLKEAGKKRGIRAPAVPDVKKGIDEPDLVDIPPSLTSVEREIAVANINLELANKLSNDERLLLEEFLLFAVIWIGFFLMLSTPYIDYALILNNFVLLNFIKYEYFVIVPTVIISGIAIISFVMIRAGTSLTRRVIIIISIPVVVFILTFLPAIAPSGIFKHLPLILTTYLIATSFVVSGILFAWYLKTRITVLVSLIASAIAYALLVVILMGRYIFYIIMISIISGHF